MLGQSSRSIFSGWTSLTNSAHSCRRRNSEWVVAMNRWQDLTTMVVNEGRFPFVFHSFSVAGCGVLITFL